jgi:glycosyltransferase involved in cell wall biosynthesis
MKIAALTMIYNEALILPYFLKHYEYLDEIHVLYETDSTDRTLEILKKAPNVIIRNVHINEGLDDIDKVGLLNNALREIKTDWVYVLDSDEFIFPPYEPPHDFLRRQDHNVVRAIMFQVYRHRTDKDLDPSLPPVPQRIHGDPDVLSDIEQPNRDRNVRYIKPIVVRPSDGIQFAPGNHIIEGKVDISPDFYLGAHWQMADPLIAIDRRLKNKARLSARNKANGMGWQHFNITEEWIRTECDSHLDDPAIEVLAPGSKKSPAEINAFLRKYFVPESILSELKKQIGELNQELQNAKNDNLLIRNSASWWLSQKIDHIINVVMPLKSRRRQLARRIFNYCRRK